MEVRNKSDLFSGAGIAAFGIYTIVQASRLTYVSEFGPGPGFMPFWLGIGMLALALCLISVNLLRPAPEQGGGRGSRAAAARALSGWAALIVAILLLPRLGFGLSLALLTIFLIVVLERRPFWTALCVALGMALGFHLIFVFALGLSLPLGPWGF